MLSRPEPEIRVTTTKPWVAISIFTPVNLALPKSIGNSQGIPYIHTCQMYIFAERYIHIDNHFKLYKFLTQKYSSLHIHVILCSSQSCIFKYNTNDSYLHSKWIYMYFSKSFPKHSKAMALRSTSTHLVFLEEPDWPPPLASRPLQYRDRQLVL